MVCILADGSVVQDFETPENANTAIPYPIFLDPFTTPVSYITDTHGVVEEVFVENPVVRIFYGAHVYEIDEPTAALLTSAGYGAYIE
jgi:hypothetical protein